uniref:Uncharacterized protein n=1 Tax=mine drainage metagenome TaxID=410659 RepID=E6QLJ5_9ZZZZ
MQFYPMYISEKVPLYEVAARVIFQG